MFPASALRKGRHPPENIHNSRLDLDVQGGECLSLAQWLGIMTV
jgi:hypothetical protein